MAKRKKKMGRPTKKAKDRRSRPVTLRVTPSCHKQLKQDAKQAGMSISAYLLQCWQITKDKKVPPLTPVEIKKEMSRGVELR